jgi:multidrug efflux pump subunit AcrB
VEGPDHNLTREKEVEDWIAEKQLKTVPGVIDVTGFGGLAKEYHVDVDPQKLNYYQVPLSTLVSSIADSNINVGGNYLPIGNQVFDVPVSGSSSPSTTSRESSSPVIARFDSCEQRCRRRCWLRHPARCGEHEPPQRGGRGYRSDAQVRKHVGHPRWGEGQSRELNASNIRPRGYRLIPFYWPAPRKLRRNEVESVA